MDIQYLLFLQNLREAAPEIVNKLLYYISEFADSSAPVIVYALVYWCLDKKAGRKMLITFGAALSLNQWIKNTVCAYRPWVRDSRIQVMEGAMESATGYSFPSGHTTEGVVFYGSSALALRKKNKAWIIPCVILALLTAFARNWLGAHTPQDVVVALIIGTASLLLCDRLMDWAEQGTNRDLLVAGIGLAICILFLIHITVKSYPLDYLTDGTLLVDPEVMSVDCYKAGGVLIGALIGWVIENRWVRFTTEVPAKNKVLRLICGVALMLGLNELKAIPKKIMPLGYAGLLHHIVLFLFLTAIYPALFNIVEKASKKGQKNS